jgi:hypothetical protein
MVQDIKRDPINFPPPEEKAKGFGVVKVVE